jgi:uncharacterized protein YqjF (DUF2071 family)
MKPKALLQQTAHRPWPVPNTPWIIEQRWVDVLFAHYPLPLEAVRAQVPEGLELDTFDGRAWVSVVAFRIDPFKPRALPLETRFPELNLRTYVTVEDKPGVYFFSLDAASRSAVMGARTMFRLNYYYAGISVTGHGRIDFISRRLEEPRANFRATYRTAGDPLPVFPGSLEDWLVERYCLYAARGGGRVFRVQIHHLPWVLQPASAELQPAELFAAARLPAPDSPPLLHYSARQDTLTWGPEVVGESEVNPGAGRA